MSSTLSHTPIEKDQQAGHLHSHGACSTCPPGPNAPGAFLRTGFYNAFDLCLDEMGSQLGRPPKRILMLGGSRQYRFAQYVALKIPYTQIVSVDPDAAVTQRATEQVGCRLQYTTAPLNALPFEDDAFELTLAHNLFELLPDSRQPDSTVSWEQCMAEIARVTTGQLMLSHPQRLNTKLLGWLPAVKGLCALEGVVFPEHLPDDYTILSHIFRYGKVIEKYTPFPWVVLLARMKPIRETRLQL